MKHIKLLLMAGLTLSGGCGRHTRTNQISSSVISAQPINMASAPAPLTLILLSQPGDGRTDREIRHFQDLVRQGTNRNISMERLGWLFIAKARESFDPGYYKMADACSAILSADSPGSPESMLLHGYVLENMHRFKETEPIARELVAKRGLTFDYGLLGDSLMEQGKLDQAVTAYQKMVDLRPDLQSYARVAHIRWLKGDTSGAIEALGFAVDASSPNDPDSAAWVSTRLGNLQFQSGMMRLAQMRDDAALEVRSNYPPALLLRGKMLLAQNQPADAVHNLEIAAQANPLPEYQWALAEALRVTGRTTEALALESRLKSSGALNDPRTLSLFLATRGEDTAKAVRLAQAELEQRQDVFTHDACAWALAANGQIDAAKPQMAAAVAEGTEDARLFFHATAIAHQAGEQNEARKWYARAAGCAQMLLPSERTRLGQLAQEYSATNRSEPLESGIPAPLPNLVTVK